MTHSVFLIGIFLLIQSFTGTITVTTIYQPHGSVPKITHPYACHKAVLYNMILSSLYTLESMVYEKFEKDARAIMNDLEENTWNDGMMIKCNKKANRLDGIIKAEMARQRFHPDLINDCPVETLPYNLFLCKLDWPEDVKAFLPNLCTTSCNKIKLWTKYHHGNRDFPSGWLGQIENEMAMQVGRNIRPTPLEYTTFEYAMNFGSGVSMAELGIQMNTRSKRQHGELPRKIPIRYVKDFFNTNSISIGNWSAQAHCRDDDWPFAVEDGLPFGLTIHCWGPLGSGGTHTIGQMNKTEGKIIDCNKQVTYKPPNGSYLIGMSTRIRYSPDILVAGVFLCSGEEKWTQVKTDIEFDTRNGTGEIVRCAPGTIICTFELKLVDYENKTFTTDVRVGCCEAPERLLYSSLTIVPMNDGNKRFQTSRYKDDSFRLVDFTRDYYPDIYGGFLNSFSLGFDRDYGYSIYYGYAHFDYLTTKKFEDENPILNVENPENYQTCQNGFLNQIQLRYCNSRITATFYCTSGETFVDTRTDRPNCTVKVILLGFQCPKTHLICGFRKYLPSASSAFTWIGYSHIYFCCPVLYTAKTMVIKNQP